MIAATPFVVYLFYIVRYVETSYALEDIPTLDRLLARILPDGATRDAVVSSLTREASHRAPRSPARFTELPVLCKDGTTRYVVAGVSWAGERQVATLMDVTDRWLANSAGCVKSNTLRSSAGPGCGPERITGR